jgi:hypothetical protein
MQHATQPKQSHQAGGSDERYKVKASLRPNKFKQVQLHARHHLLQRSKQAHFYKASQLPVTTQEKHLSHRLEVAHTTTPTWPEWASSTTKSAATKSGTARADFSTPFEEARRHPACRASKVPLAIPSHTAGANVQTEGPCKVTTTAVKRRSNNKPLSPQCTGRRLWANNLCTSHSAKGMDLKKTILQCTRPY